MPIDRSKQIALAETFVANDCKMSIPDLRLAAAEAGYGPESIRKVKNVIKARSFQNLVNELLFEAGELKADPNWVLSQSIKAFKTCMKHGAYSAAKGFLEMVGKHKDIDAFQLSTAEPNVTVIVQQYTANEDTDTKSVGSKELSTESMGSTGARH